MNVDFYIASAGFLKVVKAFCIYKVQKIEIEIVIHMVFLENCLFNKEFFENLHEIFTVIFAKLKFFNRNFI